MKLTESVPQFVKSWHFGNTTFSLVSEDILKWTCTHTVFPQKSRQLISTEYTTILNHFSSHSFPSCLSFTFVNNANNHTRTCTCICLYSRMLVCLHAGNECFPHLVKDRGFTLYKWQLSKVSSYQCLCLNTFWSLL